MKTRKRLLSIALALLMVLTLLPATALQAQAAGVFAGGSGTPEDPYRIATAEQLDTVRNYRDKHFVLTADITLTENWMPIGPSSNKAFTGTFDGNWHTISGLAISGPGHTYYGLFGYIAGAEICNLSLQNVEIDAQYEYGSWVGGLTGYATGNSIIENCYIEGSVSGTSQSKTGGLAGSVVGAAIIQCFVDVNVTSTAGNAGAGGLAASLSGKGSRITNSYAVGSVTGYYAGGMVGVLEGAASVENSYAVGAVSSESGGGGLVGMKSGTGGQVTDSYYDKETTGWTNSPAGTGKSTKEMQTATPFSNWNTSIWHFEAGKYPALYYQLKQYRVTYNLNGNHGSVPADANTYCGFDSVTAAASDGLTPPEGKAFKEWNTKSDGSGVAYAAGGTFGMPGGDRTLFAIWDTLHAVSYDLNAGSGTAPSSEQHFAGDTFTAADAAGITAPAGKRFLEWNTTENGDGTAYKSGDSVTMPAANLTLYAIWEKYQDGSEEHPFLVNDYEDMYAVRDGLGLHYRQTADITLPDSDFDYEEIEDLPSYSNWAPLGYEWNPDTESYDSNPFTGSYDGGGYTISNLIIDTDAFQFAGLFGYIADGAELKNICLADVELSLIHI